MIRRDDNHVIMLDRGSTDLGYGVGLAQIRVKRNRSQSAYDAGSNDFNLIEEQ